jgi:hypothetical protein
MGMKEAVKSLIKSPATFVILILILLLALLFIVRSANSSGEGVSELDKIELPR